jgi:hypothetical protein
MEKLKGGRKIVEYDARFGQPSTLTYVEVKKQINQCIRDNRRNITLMKLHPK